MPSTAAAKINSPLDAPDGLSEVHISPQGPEYNDIERLSNRSPPSSAVAFPDDDGHPEGDVRRTASADHDLPEARRNPHSQSSPLRPTLRKRRQRPQSSADGYLYINLDGENPSGREVRESPQSTIHSSKTNRRPAPNVLPHQDGQPDGTSGSSSASGQPGEYNLTLRRREANRLAAQRFRSRKKGYQDSLEDRVRQLEDERDALHRRLGEGPGPSSRAILGIGPDEDGLYPPGHRHSLPMNIPSVSQTAPPSFSRPSISPEGRELSTEMDIRMIALESANRKLQDELRSLMDENERLVTDVEGWRNSERDLQDNQSQPWHRSCRESDSRVSSCSPR